MPELTKQQKLRVAEVAAWVNEPLMDRDPFHLNEVYKKFNIIHGSPEEFTLFLTGFYQENPQIVVSLLSVLNENNVDPEFTVELIWSDFPAFIKPLVDMMFGSYDEATNPDDDMSKKILRVAIGLPEGFELKTF